MYIFKYFVLVVLYCTTISETHAQNTYRLPHGSPNNTICLTMNNASQKNMDDINVSVIEKPLWLKMVSDNVLIKTLRAGERKQAQLVFDLEDTAPCEETQKISFKVSDKEGHTWFKVIELIITIPECYTLHQNYPNPFNPNTVIKYSLPEESTVKLSIFNILGERVWFESSETVKPGTHQAEFDGSHCSSGIYFYTMESRGKDGSTYFNVKKMTLLK
jgi:hypothetical protein